MQDTEGQKRVIDAAIRAYHSGKKVFQFSGGPGTGKSYTLNRIISELGINRDQVAPMSYIGQAAIIMRLKGFANAKTIHSWIYSPEMGVKKNKDTNEIMYDPYLGIPMEELQFKSKPLHGIKLMVIDEGGTVPFSMKKDIEKHNIPIIVAGDINQLPPVADKPAYLYGYNDVMILDQVMRQKEGSGILYLADRALAGLPIQRGFYGDAMVIYDDEVTNEMLAASDAILCGTNRTRERINNLVRKEILGYNSDIPQYFEKIICRKNDWNLNVDGIGLGNGLTGRIVSPVDISEYDGTIFKVDFMPDLFNGVFRNIDINYEYFKAPISEKQKIKMKMFAHGIPGHCFDYAYCITTHLAQGAEYPNVIYFEENVHPEIQNRLNFTAITRASHGLIYVKKKQQFFFS